MRTMTFFCDAPELAPFKDYHSADKLNQYSLTDMIQRIMHSRKAFLNFGDLNIEQQNKMSKLKLSKLMYNVHLAPYIPWYIGTLVGSIFAKKIIVNPLSALLVNRFIDPKPMAFSMLKIAN